MIEEEAARQTLGSDKSSGYVLEMICAELRAGANLEDENSDLLILG